MANDQLTPSDETDYFLQYLLRCALTAPGAATSPTAGRILARLLVVGAVEGGDELITPYLVPVPGTDATFEVRNYQPGDLVPTDVREGLRAAAALKIALRGARDSDDGIEVVSRTAFGLERCVLVRDSTGDFEFRFAGPETLIGEPDECLSARSAWTATLASWRAELSRAAGAEYDHPRAQKSEAPALGSGSSRDDASGGRTGPPEDVPRAPSAQKRGAGWWVPSGDIDEVDRTAPPADLEGEGLAQPKAPSDPALDPRAPTVGSLIQGKAPYPSVETTPSPVDTAPWAIEVDEAPAETAEPPAEPAEPGDLAAAQPPDRATAAVANRPASPLPADDPLSSAIRDAIANLVVEVDLSQVEQLIRRVLDDDHREMVEPLARRLSARLGESLDRPDTQVFVDAMSELIPRPSDLAEAVAADVGALLSETVLRRRPGDAGGGLDAFNLMVGMEQLQVRLDGMHDQLQKSAGLLQAMGDHLEAGDRRAAIAERITTSVDQEMQRLAGRIDEQVAALAASAGGGSELADGVARLTRKLRQSVAQFDRVLLRMDEMVDQVGGGPEPEPTPAEEPEPRPRSRPYGPPSGSEMTRRLPRPTGPMGPAARR